MPRGEVATWTQRSSAISGSPRQRARAAWPPSAGSSPTTGSGTTAYLHRRGLGPEHAPPRRAAVLTLHPGRLVPLLEETRSRPPPAPHRRRTDAPQHSSPSRHQPDQHPTGSWTAGAAPRRGGASPACSASCHPFLRSTGRSSTRSHQAHILQVLLALCAPDGAIVVP